MESVIRLKRLRHAPGSIPLRALVVATAGVLASMAWGDTAPQATRPPVAIGSSDSLAAERDSLMNNVLKTIAGREKAPAESVFTNIKVLKGMPAGRVPRVMNIAFGRSLGVSCGHCHVIGEWAKDDKPKKQVAREMWTMMKTVNTEYLAKIQGLASQTPSINCTTCHRGQLKPAQDF